MIDIARERTYFTPLAASPLLPIMLISLASQKNSPSPTKTPSTIDSEYDFIIVGAGSAGSTVASRLSEIPCVKILLLEAGGVPPLLNDIPAFGRNFWFTDIDWAYKTVPQNHTGRLLINRQVIWPSGKGLGGSSLLNAMLYTRGNRHDYDDWAAQGADGWSYDDVLPYFLKLEDNKNIAYLLNGYHGIGGPITVEKPNFATEIKNPIYKTGLNLGYEILDSNGPRQTGFYDFQATVRRQQRCSTAKGYLVPAENRTNLHILPKAHVKKVIIENYRAVGVSFDVNGKTFNVKARKEVIMSAGTTNTAQMLMLSGIGPKKELQKHGINVVADLRVGENFQEHCSAVVNFELDPSIPDALQKVSDENNIIDYILNRRGPLTGPELVSVMTFLNSKSPRPIVDDPNFENYFVEIPTLIPKLQFGLMPSAYKQIYGPYEKKPFYICLSQILKVRSKGFVKLKSTNPFDSPLINPNYLANPQDLRDMIEGMKMCLKIGTSKELQRVGSKPFNTTVPGCEEFLEDMDKYLECVARSVIITMSHQVRTAKMGNPRDPTTVVDPLLRVKGVQGLRVVDASIMPIIPSGNTNIPTIMVAEKASDIIKDSIDCEYFKK